MSGLEAWRDRHRGETLLVAGCGRSLNALDGPPPCVSIGVNDVGRAFDPTYLVVLNPRSQFRGDRWRAVETSRARAIFASAPLAFRHPREVRLPLGRRGGVRVENGRVPYTRNSPYVALALALFMGARKVGLIGVDFTDGHFFAPTGAHPLSRDLARIDAEYRALAAEAARAEVEIVNLSRESRLTALPHEELDRFLDRLRPRAAPPPAPPAPGAPPAPAAEGPKPAAPLRVRVVVSSVRPINAFLGALADAAAAGGHAVTRGLRASRPDEVAIVWNGRRHVPVGPTLYCEHGWLPRSDFQVSWRGINADSHAAPFRWDGRPLAPEAEAALEARLATLRDAALGAGDAPDPASLPDGFVLLPLQMEQDTNLIRHAPPELRRMQAFVDRVAAWRPAPPPLIVKQHPTDARFGGRQLAIRMRRPQDRLWPHARGGVHGLLASGRCRAVVTVNSNVAHDALLWNVPVIALGRNVWPSDGDGPFLAALPRDWDEPSRHLARRRVADGRRAYAAHLVAAQWTLEDAADPARVEALLREAVARAPAPAPARPPARPPARVPPRPAPAASRPLAAPPALGAARTRPGPPPRLNVYARDRGWRFEELKRRIAARAAERGEPVLVTERPLPTASAWIALRAAEAAAAPDPARTVVHIHDLFDARAYGATGERRAALGCATLHLTHPAQREILREAGLAEGGARLLCGPLGRMTDPALRETAAAEFTVGWFGRPETHQGRDVARLDRLVEALRRLGPPFRVVLAGERLEAAARALSEAGAPAGAVRLRREPLRAWGALYAGLDALLVTAAEDPGPFPMFDALAAGVPVVATRAGWAPETIREGETGFLADDPEEMAAALARLREARDAWLARAPRIRASASRPTLLAWIDEDLDAARALAASARPPSAPSAASAASRAAPALAR